MKIDELKNEQRTENQQANNHKENFQKYATTLWLGF